MVRSPALLTCAAGAVDRRESPTGAPLLCSDERRVAAGGDSKSGSPAMRDAERKERPDTRSEPDFALDMIE
jgi:hypothetical protein